jgi:hypothetical protein
MSVDSSGVQVVTPGLVKPTSNSGRRIYSTSGAVTDAAALGVVRTFTASDLGCSFCCTGLRTGSCVLPSVISQVHTAAVAIHTFNRDFLH